MDARTRHRHSREISGLQQMGAGRVRKPLTKAETDELNGVLERAAQRMERRKRTGHPLSENELQKLSGVLSQLREEPRDE
jgi:hypothetical protein